MQFDHRHYVPCLRWKQGEYQAVSRLPIMVKENFTPLIEAPEIGWDHENSRQAKTIDEHLAPFAKRIYRKWGQQACFVDLGILAPFTGMESGVHPLRFVFDQLRTMECEAIPVTEPGRDKAFQREVKRTLDKDRFGVCLRIPIEQAAKDLLRAEVDSLLSALGARPQNCDLVLDLDAPNFVPLDGFSRAILAVVTRLPHLREWRTFAVLGTSFPETVAGIRKGGERIQRYEWQLYKLLATCFNDAGIRLPTFGDHVIAHPKVLDLDMRLVKPSATIRYAIEDGWYVVKGENVRDYKFEQYRELSKNVVNSPYYYGSTFSWGDEYIMNCATGVGKTGNLSMWRQVGTNHHVTVVTQDIASFYASSDSP